MGFRYPGTWRADREIHKAVSVLEGVAEAVQQAAHNVDWVERRSRWMVHAEAGPRKITAYRNVFELEEEVRKLEFIRPRIMVLSPWPNRYAVDHNIIGSEAYLVRNPFVEFVHGIMVGFWTGVEDVEVPFVIASTVAGDK